MDITPQKEAPLQPKTCIPSSKYLPPLPFAEPHKDQPSQRRELQLQALLKENLELAEENQKLRHEIAFESQQHDVLLQQNEELRCKVSPNKEDSLLNYSSSRLVTEEKLDCDFMLSEGSSEGGVNALPAEERHPHQGDTVLLTEEEMFLTNMERSSIRLPRFFMAKQCAYFAKEEVKVEGKRAGVKEVPTQLKGHDNNAYYKEMEGIISKMLVEDKTRLEQGKRTDTENPEVVFQTEELATPMKECMQTPCKPLECPRIDKIKTPSNFITDSQ